MIEKIAEDEYRLKGNVEFTLKGYPTVEEWVQNESEQELKSLLLELFEQLK